MKTIFVSSFHSLTSRVLEAGVVLGFVEAGFRVVLFVPKSKEEYFRATFGGPSVVVRGVNLSPTRLDAIFQNLAFALTPARAMATKWRCDIRNRFGYWLNGFVRCVPPIRPIFRFLFSAADKICSRSRVLDEFFAKESPVGVFSTDIQNFFDVLMVRAAKRRRVRSVGMIRSWDNPTCKGLLREFPDLLIVGNDVLKKEATTIMRYPAARIKVIGIPHYDLYVNEPRTPRAEFLKKNKLDPSKKIIFFAPAGDRYIDTDWQMFRLFDEILKENPLGVPTQVFVRLPPGDTVSLKRYEPSKSIIFYQPGVGFAGQGIKNNEMSLDDVRTLADQLHYSDVVVSGPSTIIVDAAAMDKPVIFYALDGAESDRPICRSLKRYLRYEHLESVIRTGGVRLALEKRTLLEFLKSYLQDPSQDGDGRKRIVEEQCFKLDGRSVSRLVETVTSFL